LTMVSKEPGRRGNMEKFRWQVDLRRKEAGKRIAYREHEQGKKKEVGQWETNERLIQPFEQTGF